MLVVPMTSMATHNSIGGHINIVQADEFNDDGSLAPDIGEDLRPSFHTHLDTARPAPQDQSGDRYTDCDKPGDVGEEAYMAGLTADGNSCYVGFIDNQREYLFATTLLLVKQPNDLLYPANPDPENEECQDPVARLTPACAGAGHGQFIPGQVAIDSHLLEAATPTVAQATTPEPGSGYLSLPFIATPYIFLFGQPHPDVVAAEEASPFEAGSGPFGPNPAEGGSPLFDLTGACGDRTADCRLLTPEDIKKYDSNSDNLGDLVGDDSQARFCSYTPQFVILNPDGRAAGLCGVFGRVVNQFVGVQSAGGLGVPGAPGTWQNILPGWYDGVITVSSPGDAALAVRAADEYQCAADDPADLFLEANDCDGENSRVENGLQYIHAVNPRVPTDKSPLWCVLPNFLAEGDDSIVGGGLSDPGMYGAYIADAVDTDVYRRALQDVHEDISESHHQTVRNALGPGESGASGAQQLADDVISGSPLPPDVQQALLEASDRAQYVEGQDPASQKEPFQVTRDPGIACDAQGLPQVSTTSQTLDGDLAFNTQVSRTGDVAFSVLGLTFTEVTQDTAVKDPTVLQDGMPAKESDTNRGVWMARQYSFGGSITAFLDTSEDAVDGDGIAEFSGCADDSGGVQPNADLCAWEAMWDAYNPECTDIDGNPCEGIIEDRGYDLDAGVGLTFAVKVTGPVAVTDEDIGTVPPRPEETTSRTAVLGLENPSAQNCIVGFSIGLPGVLGDEAVQQIVDDACEGTDGEQLVIEDGFDDQSLTAAGFYSAAIDFAPLLPSPAAGVDATGLGAGDEVCVTGIWNVLPAGIVLDEEGDVVSDGTATDTRGLGDFTLTHAENPHTWTECHPFETSA